MGGAMNVGTMEDHVKKMLLDVAFGHRVSGSGMVFWSSPAEVLAYVATLPEAAKVEWCAAHDNKWLDATPIHQGCGWANELKPCVKGRRYLVVPWHEKEDEE